jgi:hypothetical protein
MMTTRTIGFFSLLLCLSACAGAESEPKTAAQAKPGAFTYAPALDQPRRETMRRIEEVSIPGSPMRESEQWTMEWQVVTTRETNLFRRNLRLVALKININGAEQLRGDEVKASQAAIDVLTDKDSNVVDVRGTEDLSSAIVKLADPKVQPILARVFSPARLKMLVVMRSMELHADFVGRPTAVGSQWIATDQSSNATRQISIVGEAPCGATQCLKVVRKYDLDQQALYGEISGRVAAYVQAQGGDPTKVSLVGMEVKLEDQLLIDPATMDFHGARFNQEAKIRVAGPNGELPVVFSARRETDVGN